MKLDVNWSDYNGPEYYQPHKVTEALSAIIHLNDGRDAQAIAYQVLYALGNDHAGTYYPAILSALDILIKLEKNSEDNKVRQNCIREILNKLYYFEPEIGTYSGYTAEQLRAFCLAKLAPYSDEKESRIKYFVLLGTAGCHLCETAHEILISLLKKYPVYSFNVIDIAEHTSWQKEYAIHIPVLYHPRNKLGWPFDEAAVVKFINELPYD